LAESAGVPQFVAEVFSALDAVFLETNVLPLRGDRNDAEAQSVGAILVDQVERIGRVAERFRHLVPL